MMSELNWLVPWLGVGLAALSLIYTITTNRANRNDEKFVSVETKVGEKASKDYVAELAKKVDVVEDKVSIIQNDLRHLPDKDTTHRLEFALGKMESEMGRLNERMKPIASMADRMQEALIEKVMS